MDNLARYLRNRDAISAEEQLLLAQKKIALIGLGGLGAYVLEYLGRLGVGKLTVVDGDTFEESNLNRQLLSSMAEIGKPKAEAAFRRMLEINPLVKLNPICRFFTEENAAGILRGHDVVVDALDNIPDRLLLERETAKLGIPLVHGAIAGWCGQVCTIMPGDNTLRTIYKGVSTENYGEEALSGSLSFTAAIVAALQAAEVVKLLLGRGELRRTELLHLDILRNNITTMKIEIPLTESFHAERFCKVSKGK